ncbi:hypothetical protein TCAL_11334 [Tigriopus californicus]|uniref:Uncharacterized protein n=1 Tax=Tigriopus californicus TaxID=6832 RepID=A0A553P6Y9_TIGCA|nr:uncharacterized protein LOC131878277 [Tigriopus californicus]TRY73447.1 hypothetical protein TCAL_11334 [Tigriopus californicus]
MAILQTCYCCSSLKQLSLVGGCFTLLLSSLYVFIYYGGESGAFTMVRAIKTNGSILVDNYTISPLSDKRNWNESSHTNPRDPGMSSYIEDNRITHVVQGSIINPEGFDLKENSGFYFAKSICDIMVIISCVILFVGLWHEIRCYLLPWIALSTLQAGFSLVDTFSKLSLDTTTFEPKTAFIFTLTFLLMFAQIYFILGSVSLFQENFRCANNNNINNSRGEALLGQTPNQKKPSIHVKNGQGSKAIYVPMKVLRDGKTILVEDPYQLTDFKVIPTLLLQSPYPNEGSVRRPANNIEAGLRPLDVGPTITRRLNRSTSTRLEVIQETSLGGGSQSGDDRIESQELELCEKTEEPPRISNQRNSTPVLDIGLNNRYQHTQPRIGIEMGDQQILAQDNETLSSERSDHNLSSKQPYLVALQMAALKTSHATTIANSLASLATASATTITASACSSNSKTINTTNTTSVVVATTPFSTNSIPTPTPTPIIPTKTNIMLSALPTETCLSSVKIPTNPPNFWPSAKLVLKYIAGNTNTAKEKDPSIESNLVASNCTKNVDPIIDDDFKDDIW